MTVISIATLIAVLAVGFMVLWSAINAADPLWLAVGACAVLWAVCGAGAVWDTGTISHVEDVDHA